MDLIFVPTSGSVLIPVPSVSLAEDSDTFLFSRVIPLPGETLSQRDSFGAGTEFC